MRPVNIYAKMYRKQLLIMVYCTLFYTAIVTTILFSAMSSFIKYQVSNSVYASAVAMVASYDLHEVDHLQVLMNDYQDTLNIDSAIYINDQKVLCTERCRVDSVLDSNIHEEILKKGIYIKNDINVNGDGYYNCYLALHDKDGNYVGTVFVGKDVQLMESTLRGKQMLYIVFIWFLAMIFICGIFIVGSRYYARYLDIGGNEPKKITKKTLEE